MPFIQPLLLARNTTSYDGLYFSRDYGTFIDSVAYFRHSPNVLRRSRSDLFHPLSSEGLLVPCPWNPSRGLGLVDILRTWRRCVEEGH
jgi:hypothetical protein